jgi:hypothetical protein
MATQSRDYPPELIDKALALAATIGLRSAAEQLAIPYPTVQAWTKHPRNAERWAELRRIHAPKWRERAAIPLEELVDSYSEKLVKALQKADESLEKMEPRDIPNYIRSIAVAQGVAADHVAKLRGQPTHVTQVNFNAPQLEQAMQELLNQAVDSTAEELPALPAQAEDPGPDGP